MRRRNFLSALGGAATWPLAVRAQPASSALIGFLSSLPQSLTAKRVASFGQGLREAGYKLGQDVVIDIRHADGRYDRLPGLAAELVARRVKLIAALSPPAAQAAKSATSTIPIVFVAGFDPVKAGLVRSLGRPGGNVTGVTFVSARLGPKRLELLRELVPNIGLIALLTNPNSPDAVEELHDIETVARTMGQRMQILHATRESELEAALRAVVEKRAEALIIGADPFLFQYSSRIVAFAARHSLPAIHVLDEEVAAGGLISYGASVSEAWRLAGHYAAKILRGERVADLPVQQSTKVQLSINLKTARALGLAVPQQMLVRADEIFE